MFEDENRDYPALRWRKLLNKTQKQAADLCGITQSAWCKMEKKEVLKRYEFVRLYPLFITLIDDNSRILEN